MPWRKNQYTYLNALPTNILIYSNDGTIAFANKAALKSLRTSLEELKGVEATDLHKTIITVNNKPFINQKLPLQIVLKTKKPVSAFLITIYLFGKHTTFQVTTTPIFDDNGEILEVISAFTDITKETKQREFQQIFIKLLGHELKQPLGLIGAYSYYIKKYFNKHEDRAGRYVQKIESQVKLLTQMFNDITDTTRFNLDTFSIRLEPTDLLEVLKSTLADIRTVYPNRIIVLNETKEVLPKLQLDAIRIRQIFSNLVNNAIKYSRDDKKVTIKVRKVKNDVLIDVIDQGTGISEKELLHIFEPYYRSKLTKHKRGLGLGLALVKNIANRHNGEVLVKSDKKHGSTFTIKLPIS